MTEVEAIEYLKATAAEDDDEEIRHVCEAVLVHFIRDLGYKELARLYVEAGTGRWIERRTDGDHRVHDDRQGG